MPFGPDIARTLADDRLWAPSPRRRRGPRSARRTRRPVVPARVATVLRAAVARGRTA